MTGPSWSLLLTCFSLVFLLAAYRSATRIPDALSPEGCRMSYMWPSYVLQTDFNRSWTPLSQRYTLWLYREAGWEKPTELHGVPVLFIPGNAGSSKQARSIASSACRQYYATPTVRTGDFPDSMEALDVYTAEFNEDLSAFHGPTLLAQSRYIADAVSFILSKYRPGTKIVIMGHSMGGVVAMSLLPSPHISAVITMSTPHTLPPARFDRRIEDLFARSRDVAANDTTPVLSICGGATDLMIPSESCILPQGIGAPGFRKTIFTGGMDGVWTGVSHQAMVWCHQVRWRVARAALEIGATKTAPEAAGVLDKWFRNEASVETPAISERLELKEMEHEHVVDGKLLRLRPISHDPRAYIFSAPSDGDGEFVLLASGAKVADLGPLKPSFTTVTVLSCTEAGDALALDCVRVKPTSLRLLPLPKWGQPYPVAKEGAAESEGVVAFRAALPASSRRIVVKTALGFSDAWLAASLVVLRSNPILVSYPFLGSTRVSLDPIAIAQDLRLSFGPPTSLLVYKVNADFEGSCGEFNQLPPLLLHQTSKAELHIHPLHPRHRPRLHSHATGPFMSSTPVAHGTKLTLFSSGNCGVRSLNFQVDWPQSFGVWAMRYWVAVATWGVGVVGAVILRTWHVAHRTGASPSFSESLEWTVARLLPIALPGLTFLALLPLPASALLGNSGNWRLALVPPLVLVLSFAYVFLAMLLVKALTAVLGMLKGRRWRYSPVPPSDAEAAFDADTSRHPPSPVTFGRLMSMGLILLLVAFFVPYQVAYVVFLTDFIWSCAIFPSIKTESSAQREHVLMLLLVILPLKAPVLPVWVRTLLTAGYTAPFDGDHGVHNIIPMMVLMGFAPPNPRAILWEKQPIKRWAHEVTRILLFVLVGYSFLFGPRWTFGLYDLANMLGAWLALVKYGRILRN
ncbi:PGAP1-domain-containing protein [Auricularia subglabra TFB-10046 SS5]|nr:PGAP1-domain-containing protein [Auricularia subglabra TFB-10046 SS5]